MRVTIFGAAGLLGKALMGEWTGDEVTGVDVQDGDIRDAQQVSAILDRLRPEWVILAAAFTDVDACESNRQLAFNVNCHGAVNVAKASIQVGARLLFLSTDYVFDGTKTSPYEVDDPRNPRSVYGESKTEAEIQLLSVLPDCCIVRTSWLFGVGGKSFPDTILKLAENRKEIDVVDDQRGSPTYAPDLSRTIMQLCRRGAGGIVHVTNRGECSWYEFACKVIDTVGSDTLVRPTSTEKFVRPARRPKYSVLSPKSLDSLDIFMPTWQDALLRYLQARRSEK